MKNFFTQLGRTLGGEKLLRIISQSSDVILAFFVIIIIMMIIVPVSPGFIDNLVAINMAVSIALMMVALYISKAVNLSMFPSLLLITTLFRLGIEISATKQILLYAYAGDIIQTFGNFVVGGNFIVGAVIFLIITIVQFIVVTKGSERVAEVAARFTLDAMPGKQMSIDADMRSGIIDVNQARDLRLALTKESQLYGAMDGAMKFVKGDVIAGIVIAVINIIGGLIIGIVMHKMSALHAAQTYTLLSIGSGLVSQIPSLLISMTAGIVTTRVSSDKGNSSLGAEISAQLLGQPKAIIIASVVLLSFALIPGFPTMTFAVLSVVTGGMGISKWYKNRRAISQGGGSGREEVDVEGHSLVGGVSTDYALILPVILECGKSVSTILKHDRGSSSFVEKMVPKMRYALYQDLGVKFPAVHIRLEAPHLENNEYAILLNEVPILRGKIAENSLLASEFTELFKRYNIPFTQSKTVLGEAFVWIDRSYQQVLEKANIKFWKPLEAIILHLSYFYRMHGSDFLGIQEVRSIMEFVEKSFPDLVKEVTRLIPLQKITEILRRLVQEQISIKDMRTILEALSEWGQSEKDPILLTEYSRSALKRYISYKYSQGQSIIAVYLVDPEIEDIVRGAIKQTSAGSYLALDPDLVQTIMHVIRTTVVPTPKDGQPPLLLTAIDVRRFIRKLIEGEFPNLPVISYQEVVPEIRVQPLGRIQLT